MQDPRPGKSFEETLRLLSERFPSSDRAVEQNGDVFITLPLKNGGTFRAGLSWQQAKYLAYSQLTGDDLKAENFPPDWPPGQRVR